MAGARRNCIAHMQRTFLYQHRRNRALSFIQLRLDDKASRFSVRICLQLRHLCRQKDHLKQRVKPLVRMCGNRHKYGASAPILGDQPVLGQFLLYAVTIRAWLIDLVDRNNNFGTRRFCVADRLDRLRHNAVIRRYHKDCDIGRIGAAHTHCRERLVSRSIQEGNLLSVNGYRISADMLCDAACLFCDHMRIPDGIQQGGFTMVNMPHNADNRRSCNHRLLCLLFFLQQLLDHIDLHLMLCDAVVIHSDLFRKIVLDLVVHRNHRSLQEQLLHDRRSLHLQKIRKLADGQTVRNCNGSDLVFLLLCRRRCHRLDELTGSFPCFAGIIIFLIRTPLAALLAVKAVALIVFFFILILVSADSGFLCYRLAAKIRLRDRQISAALSASLAAVIAVAEASAAAVISSALLTAIVAIAKAAASLSAAVIAIAKTSAAAVVSAALLAAAVIAVAKASAAAVIPAAVAASLTAVSAALLSAAVIAVAKAASAAVVSAAVAASAAVVSAAIRACSAVSVLTLVLRSALLRLCFFLRRLLRCSCLCLRALYLRLRGLHSLVLRTLCFRLFCLRSLVLRALYFRLFCLYSLVLRALCFRLRRLRSLVL